MNAKELKDKLDELIKQGFGEFEIYFVEDNCNACLIRNVIVDKECESIELE